MDNVSSILVPEPLRLVNSKVLQQLAHLDLTGRIAFQETKLIGCGGYGDISTDECDFADRGKVKVAVKRLRFYLKGDIKLLFEKEIYVWAKLNHPNILPLLGYAFEPTGYPLLVSEWMEKGSAWIFVNSHPECDLLYLIIGIARGLAYLHEKDIVHSDIKSENIVVSKSGDARICDFGCSRLINTTGSLARLTTTVKGTPQYHAYELIAFSAKHSKQSDVWAFGMTVYELCNRCRPYASLSQMQAISAILRRKLPVFSMDNTTSSALSVTLKGICSKCWAFEPEERASMTELLHILQENRNLLVSDGSAVPVSLTSDGLIRDHHLMHAPTEGYDFLTQLTRELASRILSLLPFQTLSRASQVSKAWRALIDSDPILWQGLMRSMKLWSGGETEYLFSKHIMSRRRKAGLPALNALPLSHPYKILFKSRYLTQTSWLNNSNPKRITTFPVRRSTMVTCLILSRGRIILSTDYASIYVYSPITGRLIFSLEGHMGSVWALASHKDTLVSGSTDRTVRIWDLMTGKCTHIFGGHTSTIRCLSIVKPEMVEWTDGDGVTHRERWPKRSLIVTGSRDHTLRVWTLPRPGEEEYRCNGADDNEEDPSEEDVEENPYHRLLLEGHSHAVRALAARGRTLVSGSYDCTVRVWDIITGQSRWVLVGHTQKVYSVVLDSVRGQACSGSMDGTVRVWNLTTGQCIHILDGHTSLVGLIGLSPSYLVSASADSSLRVWDANTGGLRHCLQAHTGAVTCFQHDEFKVLSGLDGTLKMWDIRSGTFVRDLLTGTNDVWQVVSEGRWCVAASNRTDATVLDVWDFGPDDDDDDWIGEPGGGLYDDSSDDDNGGEDGVVEIPLHTLPVDNEGPQS